MGRGRRKAGTGIVVLGSPPKELSAVSERNETTQGAPIDNMGRSGAGWVICLRTALRPLQRRPGPNNRDGSALDKIRCDGNVLSLIPIFLWLGDGVVAKWCWNESELEEPAKVGG
jgi:hypothetical protein